MRGSGAVTLPDTALADAVTGFELFINAYTATTLTRASAGTLHATMNIIGNQTVGAEITALGGRLLGTGVLTLDATTVAVNCAYDKSFAGRIVTGAATVFESLPEKGMLSIQTGGFTVNSASKLGTLEVLSGTPTINATKSLTIKLLDLTDVAGATTIALGSSDANVIIEQIAPGSTGSLVITGTGSKAKLTVLKGALAAGITYSGFSGTVKLPA